MVGYFTDIKNGNLPSDELIFFIINNGVDNEKEIYEDEIKKNITLLSKSFESATTAERVYIIKVLFVLEFYISKEEAFKGIIERTVRLHLHELVDNYNLMFPKILEYIDQEFVMSVLNNHLQNLQNLSKTELRSFFNWSLHIIWNIPDFHNHSAWRSFYPKLQILLDALMEQKRVDDVMYVEFFTYHIMGNSFHTIDEWRDFNETITKRTESFYKTFVKHLPKANPRQKEKKRIALVVDRIVFNSVFQVWYSLVKSLLENEEFTSKYEIAVYSVNYFEKSQDEERCIQMVESLGILYINPVHEFIKQGYYNNHFEKALKVRKTLIQDDIDILITGGVFPIIDFLYLSRVTPLQIYWSHGNCAFDIEGIDKRISHFDQECKEFSWEIFSVPMAKEFLVGTDGEKQVGEIIKADFKQRFGEDLVILGTIGRLIKIACDDHIQMVATVMQKFPNTIYLACGTGNEEDIKEKLDKYGIDQKRFIFTGQVNPHIYGWVIDLYLAPLCGSAGQSLDEYRKKAKPYVAIHNKNWYENYKDTYKQQMKTTLYSKEELTKSLSMQPLVQENPYAFTLQAIAHPLNKEDYLKVVMRFLTDEELKLKAIEENQYLENLKKNNLQQFLKVLND